MEHNIYNGKVKIGSFFTNELVQYIINAGHIDNIEIIEKYVCKNINGNIVITNYQSSSFTNNIESLIKLFNELDNYYKNMTINNNQDKLKHFLCALLHYNINLIAHISCIIDDKMIKQKLFYYSIHFVNKLMSFIKDIVADKTNENSDILEKLAKLNTYHHKTDNKINELSKIIHAVNFIEEDIDEHKHFDNGYEYNSNCDENNENNTMYLTPNE